ncbi:hypothetical protein MCOR27_006760 [Pyricularia oryzae]|nr:hypothetical protein MCOR19_000019 [Pyricularia oryzae]KAI6275922.1 hypothetical protein MCOR27_006760 [Pyricularia oryzae]KAI6325058.1 hypothetical protein MCOR29_003901 [Pyricularia oryzae]KAI6373891.1 hypothetical protein MCOR31_002992 [Pyricularia oryzae]KAI6404569.1 hypothetical protein MCOR23_003011 [Pyricularia oryzae]
MSPIDGASPSAPPPAPLLESSDANRGYDNNNNNNHQNNNNNNHDLFSSPNSASTATPHSAFSPVLASPSPGTCTSPEADLNLQPAPKSATVEPGKASTIASLSSPVETPLASTSSGIEGSASNNAGLINAGAASVTDSREDLQSPKEGCRSATVSAGEKSETICKSNLENQVVNSGITTTTTTNGSGSVTSSPTRMRILRPKASRPQLPNLPSDLHSLHSSETPRSAVALSRASSIRSVCSNAPLQHPTPELNAKSGAYTGNVAALEATAERFSMTSSIEDAIRDAHTQLKRRDSQRSMILASQLQHNSDNFDNTSVISDAPLPPFSRHLSIASLNSAARSGGYSPSGYVMSPTHSLSRTRLRSASKASSTGPPSSVIGDVIPEDGSPVLSNDDSLIPPLPISRHGPGKSSVRSVVSAKKLSLAEIAENEPPTTLAHYALNEADQLLSPVISEGALQDSTIRPTPAQLAQMGLDQKTPNANGHWDDTPNAETWSRRPRLDTEDSNGEVDASRQQGYFPQDAYEESQGHYRAQSELSGQGSENDHIDDAFGDFDGVHCDPNQFDFDGPFQNQLGEHDYQQQQRQHEQLLSQPHDAFTQNPEDMQYGQAQAPRPQPRRPLERPQSYFDPSTGKDMLYYPAPVPAMLNLPPKLSKKPKTAVRNARYSKVLETMAQEGRASRIWLADPNAGGEFGNEFMDEPRQSVSHDAPEPSQNTSTGQGSASPTKSEFQAPELRRPAKLRDADKRMSRLSLMPSDLPPQVRASAFFDSPSTVPRIELKGGSAMATLDSILDASAKAPVSAFTDHTFAGTLGEEVYGAEKKKKKKKHKAQKLSVASIDHKRDSVSTVREAKERSSFLGIITGGKSRTSHDGSDRNSAMASSKGSIRGDGASAKRGEIEGREGEVMSPTTEMVAPGQDEQESSSGEEDDEDDDDDEEEDDEVYHGAPTTLLAELQLRKHQQKMRTRPINKAHPNGLHTTLLELDAVAEVERKNRLGKRVNLAWEDPTLAHADLSDDEDVPLAMLQAIRGNPVGDISAAVVDVNRPLGLMERREMEDNEPLSRRRDRIQGREAMQPTSVYLNPVSQTRASQLTLVPAIAGVNAHLRQSQANLAPLAPPVTHTGGPSQSGPDDEEDEDEPLGDRMRRLKARDDKGPRDDKESALPVARPVSAAFTVEMMSQLGVGQTEPDAQSSKSPKGKAEPAPEEEETLGQRRRRLQAEREAREREMNVNAGALHALTGGAGLGARTLEPSNAPAYNRLTKKISMADVLAAHPVSDAKGHMDPREAERLRFQAEAERAAREHEAKMRSLRAQQSLSQLSGVGDNPRGVGVPTSIGIGAQRQASGFQGGRFNDGAGGGTALPIGAAQDGPGHGSWGKPLHQGGRTSVYGNGFPGGQHYAQPAYGYAQPYGQMMGVQQDMVEKPVQYCVASICLLV